MKKTNTTNYRDWLEKGNHDIEDAKKLLTNAGYADTICFHAQQAAEKYLKGYLVSKKINPRAIHHLEELAKDCAKFNKGFLTLLSKLRVIARSPERSEGRRSNLFDADRDCFARLTIARARSQ